MSEITLKLRPFNTPNYVTVETNKVGRKQDGIDFNAGITYHLSELTDEILEEMCQEFRDNCFKIKNSGKPDQSSEYTKRCKTFDIN